MRILYIVNSLTKTSIPWRWSEYFNKQSTNNQIELLEIKSLKSQWKKIKENIDIVHGHHVKAMAFYLMLNKFLKKPIVYTVHGSYLFLSKSNQFLLKKIFTHSHKIIFVNQMLYDILPKEYKEIIKDKYEVILNGVETDYKYIRSDVYQKFKLSSSDIVCFHPARFVSEKNHKRLIQSFAQLVEMNSDIKLVLAGDGKLKGEMVTLVESLNLKENVLFLGLIERDEVYSFLERCDLFLMPSLSEGLNISFLEAISMKSKVLVSDIKQFTYPLKAYGLDADELNVTFVNPLDVESIKVGVLSSLITEKHLSYDASEFSLVGMMKKYVEIYNKLLKKEKL